MLDIDGLSRAELDDVLSTIENMKEILSREMRQVPTLHGRTVATLFAAEDPAARMSFEMAARALSASIISTADVYPTAEGAIRTELVQLIGSLGIDILVVRHNQAGVPYHLAQHCAGAVINAGDGAHANPAAALGDLFTLRQHLGELAERKIVLLGDVGQSGTARSLLWGLYRLGASVTLCAPATLLGPAAFWQGTWPNVRLSHSLNDAIEDADGVVVLPVAAHRYQSAVLPSLHEYRSHFLLSSSRLELAADNVHVIAHVSLDSDIAPDLVQTLGATRHEHTLNTTAARMALLYIVAGSPG
jgi:aspartate carbamoyltransferase catalytic subunit